MTSRSPIYLDHAAASPVAPEVIERLLTTLAASYANASATAHAHGDEARALVETARERVAALVGAEPAHVIFTSGTTEANHLALRGLAPKSIVTTNVEHPSVQANVDAASDAGTPVRHVACRSDGVVETAQVMEAVDRATDLVSVMHGNNETGAVNDVAALATALRRDASALFHVDAAQSARWLPIDMQASGIDLVALSSHKMGGVKGVGALVCSPRAWRRLSPVVRGGGQERGMRPGTLNVPAIDAFGLVAMCVREVREVARADVGAKRARLAQKLTQALPHTMVLGPSNPQQHLPHILAWRVPGVPATLLQAEVRADVSIATGSACATEKLEASPVLLALGLSASHALEVVRLSLGPTTDDAEIDCAADALIAAVRRLTRSVAAC